ncbi:ArsR family transcriptional regulator [Psychrosphaera haliotis]|uniref:ArsR family transcriptional regulator n=1 Tax=Psychrosphaera haliotis TaxID=555083 RepID=UPI0039BEDDDA
MVEPCKAGDLSYAKKEDLTAGDISEQIDIAKSTLSGHFNVLKEAGLVVTVKSGTTITYSLNTSVVEELMSGLINLFGSNSKNEKDNV